MVKPIRVGTYTIAPHNVTYTDRGKDDELAVHFIGGDKLTLKSAVEVQTFQTEYNEFIDALGAGQPGYETLGATRPPVAGEMNKGERREWEKPKA